MERERKRGREQDRKRGGREKVGGEGRDRGGKGRGGESRRRERETAITKKEVLPSSMYLKKHPHPKIHEENKFIEPKT